jgi:hypothetical protein
MQVKFVENRAFVPQKIEITIENEEDLAYFYRIVSRSISDINMDCDEIPRLSSHYNNMPLYYIAENIVKKHTDWMD